MTKYLIILVVALTAAYNAYAIGIYDGAMRECKRGWDDINKAHERWDFCDERKRGLTGLLKVLRG